MPQGWWSSVLTMHGRQSGLLTSLIVLSPLSLARARDMLETGELVNIGLTVLQA